MIWKAPSYEAPYWRDVPSRQASPTVHEQEPQDVKTGLLDKDGRPLMRKAERQPLGYFRLK